MTSSLPENHFIFPIQMLKASARENVSLYSRLRSQNVTLFMGVVASFLVTFSNKFYIWFFVDLQAASVGTKNFLDEIGKTLELTCNISGAPMPTFTWYKNGKITPDGSRKISVTLNSDGSFGQYVCKAKNPSGEHTVTFNIKKRCE